MFQIGKVDSKLGNLCYNEEETTCHLINKYKEFSWKLKTSLKINTFKRFDVKKIIFSPYESFLFFIHVLLHIFIGILF